jgi:hypothetical protein
VAEAGSVAALAYAEALRGLDQQAAVVDNLRSRAATLLSATSIATSFLAGLTIRDTGIVDNSGWGALACFIAVTASCVWILWPRRDWRFHASAASLVRDYVDGEGVTIDRAHRDLALHMDHAYTLNAERLRWLFRFFQLGCVLLAAEILLWIASLMKG